jgi:hypothetical protein
MENEIEPGPELDSTLSRIMAFKNARKNESTEFDCYVYRVIQDHNKKVHFPFLFKYESYLPDEQEIAEKFRGGKYKIQTIWYVNGKQKSESWTYEIDESAFPVGSPIKSLITSPQNSNDMSTNMMLMVADIVKTAYASRPINDSNENRKDPLELFSDVQTKMQGMYEKFMDIQQNVMERSFELSLEKKFGLLDNKNEISDSEDNASGAGMLDGGVIEIVKQVVDAAKMILPMLGLPGAKPVVESIKKNPAFSKYAELAKNPAIVKEIAGALRKEYGDEKAALLLKSFGINMVSRTPVSVTSASVPIPKVTKKVGKLKK